MTFRVGKKFETALRQVVSVSKEELTRMLEAEKRANEGKPKRGPKPKTASTSGHASDSNDNG
jgi:hypothetical protein